MEIRVEAMPLMATGHVYNIFRLVMGTIDRRQCTMIRPTQSNKKPHVLRNFVRMKWKILL